MNKVFGLASIVAALMAFAFVEPSAFGETILSEGFEGSFPGSWSAADDNASGTPAYWSVVDSAFGGEGTHSGSHKGYCAGVGYLGSALTPYYQNDMSARMSRPLNLSSYSAATLSFWYKIPGNEVTHDYLLVYMDNILVWNRSVELRNWTQVTMPLNTFVGGAYTLKFVFVSDAAGIGEGAYLDDILVTGTPATATIADAFWGYPMDYDGDGYMSLAYLMWDSNVSGGAASLSVRERVYCKRAASSVWTLLATTPDHSITGSNISDIQNLMISDGILPGLSHDKYDWKIEIYRVGHTTPDAVRRDTNDADLNDWKGESTAEEVSYLPNDRPQLWSDMPADFGFDVKSSRWAVIGINPSSLNRDLVASPYCNISSPRRVSSGAGSILDFVVVNGNLLHALPYYARVQLPSAAPGGSEVENATVPVNSPAYYTIEAENSPANLPIGTRLSGRSFTTSEVLDLYQVTLAAGHRYTLSVAQSGSTADVSLFLFRPSRTTAARSARDFYRNAAGAGHGESLTFTAKYSGRWALVICNENGGAGNYSILVTRLN